MFSEESTKDYLLTTKSTKKYFTTEAKRTKNYFSTTFDTSKYFKSENTKKTPTIFRKPSRTPVPRRTTTSTAKIRPITNTTRTSTIHFKKIKVKQTPKVFKSSTKASAKEPTESKSIWFRILIFLWLKWNHLMLWIKILLPIALQFRRHWPVIHRKGTSESSKRMVYRQFRVKVSWVRPVKTSCASSPKTEKST